MSGVNAFDMRGAAFHEAGHAVVARHFGVQADAWIYPRPDAGADERTWGGRCRLHPGLLREEERLVALAGEIADAILRDPDVDAWTIHPGSCT